MVGNYKINHFFYFIDKKSQLDDSVAVYMFIDHLSVLLWTEKDSVNFIVNILPKMFFTFILFLFLLLVFIYVNAVVFWKGVSFKLQSDHIVASKRPERLD